MPLGPSVRALFGRYEPQVAAAYRALYVDLDAWGSQLRRWMPQALDILEIGCGEGAVTERLAALYPEARITGIDITPRLGRLYAGDHDRVTFRQVPVETVAAEHPGRFDLVLLGDVLHHVPLAARPSLLSAVRETLAPGGCFVFKEWLRSRTPIHWASSASDRYLTGDDVSYLSKEEAEALVKQAFHPGAIRDEARIRPWRNNAAWLISM